MKVKEKLIVSTFNPDEIGTQFDISGKDISEEDVKRFRGYAERIAQKNMLLIECLALISGMCKDGADELLEDLRERIEDHLGISVDLDVDTVN